MKRRTKEKLSFGRIALIIFMAAIVIFVSVSIIRSGLMNRESEDIIARADYLLDKYGR